MTDINFDPNNPVTLDQLRARLMGKLVRDVNSSRLSKRGIVTYVGPWSGATDRELDNPQAWSIRLDGAYSGYMWSQIHWEVHGD